MNESIKNEGGDGSLTWEYVTEGAFIRRKIGRAIENRTVEVVIEMDELGREIKSTIFAPDGKIQKTTEFLYDHERKPKLVLVYDGTGRIIWRQERGRRPEDMT